jgi:uncharacterized membrane protein YdjX (TVP38/TMEM64 family)
MSPEPPPEPNTRSAHGHPAIWPRILVLALVCAVAALVALTDVVQAPLQRLLALTQQMIDADPVLGAALFVAFAALSGMLAFLSSAVLAPVAVQAWGPVYTAALLWAGWIIGGACSYAIGRGIGRPVAGLVSRTTLARYEHKISRETPFALVVLFQLAMPSEVPGYFLGMVRYSFLRYILVVALAELPYAIGTVLMGASFLDRKLLPFILLGVAGVGFSAWAFRRLRRAM